VEKRCACAARIFFDVPLTATGSEVIRACEQATDAILEFAAALGILLEPVKQAAEQSAALLAEIHNAIGERECAHS
jgi:hypothetical protein